MFYIVFRIKKSGVLYLFLKQIDLVVFTDTIYIA